MSADFIWKHWNKQYGLDQENFYSRLLHTSSALLDFKTPTGIQLNLTSLPSSYFANSHRLTIFPGISGDISFLHTSRPISGYGPTRSIPLPPLLDSYARIKSAAVRDPSHYNEIWHRGQRVDVADTLLFGRLQLPNRKLEAIYARRLSPVSQMILTAVSDRKMPNGGTVFVQYQQDYGKYSNEFVYNTDDALIGYRCMRNLGYDAEVLSAMHTDEPAVRPAKDAPLSTYGRFSAGFEVYYGALHQSGGLSAGMRFATLPSYHGPPTTMTLTLNPLVGHLSATYAIKSSREKERATLATRLDFNIFSYESDLSVGAEIWQFPTQLPLGFETPDASHALPAPLTQEGPSGLIKASIHSNSLQGRLLWEGRVRHFLVNFGGKFDLKQRKLFSLGLEIQYGA
ncbi:mitochondrial distribution and morphology protein 10 [Protomyces lactucae-debilis]|uniref:Mitochondrial distribution and morphology protein 10 n=1 Tax=Protomyces lactucae-debilis TaxID=2754530 RepID=A0A1Y2FFF8_PROLT|nr:mitochondrial distribution and morphology protein 10 [Protomyces lactucae-debilis]ORY82700.1 mitochondrial distribution and morphology protein 10 [Protomyces lactucae-debilis]